MLDLRPGVTFRANVSFVPRLETKLSLPEFARLAGSVQACLSPPLPYKYNPWAGAQSLALVRRLGNTDTDQTAILITAFRDQL